MNNINDENKYNPDKSCYISKQNTKNVPQKQPLNDNTKTDCKIENSSHEYSAILGRSQINIAFGALKKDVEAFVANPKSVENANKFFDIAYEKFNKSIDNPYEYAAVLTQEYCNMFKKD